MGNLFRDVVAAVLQGPANIMASFRTIIGTFGKDAEGAADFAWSRARSSGMTRTAAKEPTWWLPGYDFSQDPYPDQHPWWEREPKALPAVGLDDALDTVTAALLPRDDELRPFFLEGLPDFHQRGEEERRVLLDRFMDDLGVTKDMPGTPGGMLSGPTMALRKRLLPLSLTHMSTNFLKWTRSMRSADDIYRVFKGIIFKAAFMDAYEKAHRRLAPETAKRAFQEHVMFCGVPMKTWQAIEAEYDDQGRHHCLRLHCVVCNNVQTCRCSAPKESREGVCGECAAKMGREASAPRSMTASVIHKYFASLT